MLYEMYPRKEGKARGFKTLANLTSEEILLLKVAVGNYNAKCAREKTELKFIKLFSTFANEWRDWVDYKPPTLVEASLADLAAATEARVNADMAAMRRA